MTAQVGMSVAKAGLGYLSGKKTARNLSDQYKRYIRRSRKEEANILEAMKENFRTQITDINNNFVSSMADLNLQLREQASDTEMQTIGTGIAPGGSSFIADTRTEVKAQYKTAVMEGGEIHKENFRRLGKMNTESRINTMRGFTQERIERRQGVSDQIRGIQNQISRDTLGAIGSIGMYSYSKYQDKKTIRDLNTYKSSSSLNYDPYSKPYNPMKLNYSSLSTRKEYLKLGGSY